MPDTNELTCAACRAIDRVDGIEDGNLFKIEHYHARSERAALRAVLRAQDRAADGITAFAGSLRFVYIGEALGIDADHVEGVVQQAIEGARAQLEGNT